MADRLIQVVSFLNVAPAASVPLPHQININGVPQAPDFVAMDVAGFSVAVTATTVTVTNNNDAPASVNVWLELKHSIPRQLGTAPTGLSQPGLTPRPFVAATGGGGGGSDLVGLTQAGAIYNTQFGQTGTYVRADNSPTPVQLVITENSPGSYNIAIDTAPPLGYGWQVTVPYARSINGADQLYAIDLSAFGDQLWTVQFWNDAGDDLIVPGWFVAQLYLFAPTP